MSYATDLSSGLESHYDAFGEEATFTDRDGTETTVTVILGHDLTPYGPETVTVSGRYATISARRSELSYAPRRGESYTVGTTVYTVDQVLTEDDLEHTALATA